MKSRVCINVCVCVELRTKSPNVNQSRKGKLNVDARVPSPSKFSGRARLSFSG